MGRRGAAAPEKGGAEQVEPAATARAIPIRLSHNIYYGKLCAFLWLETGFSQQQHFWG